MKKISKFKLIKDVIVIALILVFMLSPTIRTNVSNFIFDKISTTSTKVGKDVGNTMVLNTLNGDVKFKASEMKDIIETAYKNNVTIKVKTIKDKKFKEYSSKNKLNLDTLNKKSYFTAKTNKDSKNKLISLELIENK